MKRYLLKDSLNFRIMNLCGHFQILPIFLAPYIVSTNYAPFDCIFFTATLLQAMARSTNISHQMEYLLATGTLVSKSGLGLMQVGSRFLCKQCSAD